ncbi:MAG TPA: hypothetical protein PKW35_10645 [Nannocystaceae bacterium]|nr:hypothetical protein [Nannocystaceae bacterium]
MFSLRRIAFIFSTILLTVGCDADDRDDIAAFEAEDVAVDGDERPLALEDEEEPGDPTPGGEIDVTVDGDGVPCTTPHGLRPLAGGPAGPEPFDPGALILDLAALEDAEDAPALDVDADEVFTAEADEPEPCDTHGSGDEDEPELVDG